LVLRRGGRRLQGEGRRPGFYMSIRILNGKARLHERACAVTLL
jgi:hypothetical protein